LAEDVPAVVAAPPAAAQDVPTYAQIASKAVAAAPVVSAPAAPVVETVVVPAPSVVAEPAPVAAPVECVGRGGACLVTCSSVNGICVQAAPLPSAERAPDKAALPVFDLGFHLVIVLRKQ
jgi:hypothetical protein